MWCYCADTSNLIPSGETGTPEASRCVPDAVFPEVFRLRSEDSKCPGAFVASPGRRLLSGASGSLATQHREGILMDSLTVNAGSTKILRIPRHGMIFVDSLPLGQIFLTF